MTQTENFQQLTVPEISKIGDDLYELEWDEGIHVKINQFYAHRDKNIDAEITITDYHESNVHILGPQRFSLTKSPRALLNDLKEESSRDDWSKRMKQISYLVLKDYRQGQPIMNLGSQPRPTAPRHRLAPVAYEGEATLVYGTGGIGKSMLVLYFAHLIHNGIGDVAGLESVVQGNVLYVDYETNWQTNWLRSYDVLQGLGLPSETAEDREKHMVKYWYGRHALVNHVQELQEQIARENIQVVIIDSAGPACGGTPEDANSALSYFSALRAIAPANKSLTTITIGHVAKGFQGAQSGPFGSVYWVNYPRSTWELRKSQKTGDSKIDLTLHHRKTNLGRLLNAMGFSMDFNNGLKVDKRTAKERKGGATAQVTKILEEYRDDGHELYKDGMTTIDLLEELEIDKTKAQSLSATLSRDSRVSFNRDLNKWQLVTW